MKRILDAVLRSAAVLSVFAIPAGFFFSGSSLTRILDSALRLKIDPRFSGGTELARFYDPAGDDHGDGAVVYPKGQRYSAAGIFDLLKYVVYKPELDAAWSGSDEREFWQLGVTLSRFENPDGAPNGFSLASIRIYIDTHKAGEAGPTGSTETAAARAELVSFDPASPWDVMVQIDGWHGRALMRTADGKAERIPLISVPEQKTLYVRLPMDIPQIKRVLDGRPTGHYMLVCGYDPLAVDGVMQVKEKAASDAAGGARSELTPRVFDVLAVSSDRQQAQLSSYDEGSFRYAVLEPVTAEAGVGGDKEVDLDALEAAAKEEARAARAPASAVESEARSEDPLRSGAALFQLGRRGEAEGKLRSALEKDPENPVAIAYIGSITAMKGGESISPAEAVRFVNEAFALLDKAAALAKTREEREIVLMNRASVASAVPEEVFSKSAAAARDFLELAEIAESRGDARAAGDGLVSAGICFERAGLTGEADVAFARALSENGLSARAVLELARRGYPIPE
jgi:tetratricopeptide (TPR) repeat protein